MKENEHFSITTFQLSEGKLSAQNLLVILSPATPSRLARLLLIITILSIIYNVTMFALCFPPRDPPPSFIIIPQCWRSFAVVFVDKIGTPPCPLKVPKSYQ